jgi:hypothetical protein
MPAKVTCIDHPVFAVNDLIAARSSFEKLGFFVPPIGRHREWCTGNICIMFARDYLEIRGIADRSRYLAGLEEFLADGEGLIGVAFGTNSADESYRAARESGLGVEEPRGLERNLDVFGKVVSLRFRNVMLRTDDHPGFYHANLCQHLTFDALRQPGWLGHPNTATSVATVVGVIDDADAAARKYAALLGSDAVLRERDKVMLRFPVGSSAELITAREAEARGIAQSKRVKNYMAAIKINVRSLDALRAVLGKSDLPCRQNGGEVVIDPKHACGAHIIFVEADARQ